MVFARVMKFGGAALADGAGVERSCAIVERHGGGRPIVVVSAHQGVTSLLESVARAAAAGRVDHDPVRIRHRTILRQLGLDSELLDRYLGDLARMLEAIRARGKLLPGERDFVLALGERMSARIVAHALRAKGILATPVDSFDLGLTTDSNHGQARPLPGIEGAIRDAVREVPGIPVVTGFLAKDSRGNLTTLGRNGSDLTAALIAEAVGARELQFWKAVGGVMTADPHLVPDARVIERLDWTEAAEYAFHGAEVLHPAALAPAQRSGIAVWVRDVHDDAAPGTLVERAAEGRGPVGIACRKQVVRLDLELGAPELRGTRLARLFAVLELHRVEPGLLSAGGEGVGVLVPPGGALDAALDDLRGEVQVTADLAQVALIGRDVGGDVALARCALELLEAAGVAVLEAFLGARRSSQAFVILRRDLEPCARALHAGLRRGALQGA